MKIRNGFVSNSSSSSFMCLMKVEDVEETLKDMPEYVKVVVNELTYKVNVFGMELIGFESYHTHSYSSWEYTEIEYEGEYPEVESKYYPGEMNTLDDPSEAWSYFEEAFKDKGYEKFEHEIDM